MLTAAQRPSFAAAGSNAGMPAALAARARKAPPGARRCGCSHAVGAPRPCRGRSTALSLAADKASHKRRGPVVVRASEAEASHVYEYRQIEKETMPGIAVLDITAEVRAALEASSVQEGCVNVLSRHTTTAVTINEAEPRLMDDIRQWLRKLAPPSEPYLHNDLHVREAPEGWVGGHAAWAAQEPINAHSHLLSIMIGNTLTLPVSKGKLCIGTWQSVLLVELDGPRKRAVGVQVVGNK
mmetsp:Transcript_19827/g.58905  ORF Transcript_19827/g.58905 Transcript_19827/m.58905 type:complete len:239 (-) Transcript_19827:176-892(-)